MKYFTAALIIVLALSAGGVSIVRAAEQGSAGDIQKDTTNQDSAGDIQKNPASNKGPSIGLINPLGSSNCSQNQTCLIDFLLKILDFVIRIGTIVIIGMMVYIGFKYVMAQGSASALGAVHNQLLWTIIGALVLLGSKAIAIGIQATVQALSVGQ